MANSDLVMVPLESQEVSRARRDRALRLSAISGAGARIATSLASIVAIAISVRALGEEQFGVLATLTALVGLAAFADLGIGSGLMNHLASSQRRQEVKEARGLVSTAFFSMTMLGLLIASFGIMLAWLLNWNDILGIKSTEISATPSVAAFFIFMGAMIPANIGQRVLLANQRGSTANTWSLLGAVLTVIATVGAAALDAPLWGFMTATLGIPAIVGILQSLHVFIFAYPELRPTLSLIQVRTLKALGATSSMFLGLNLAVTISYQSDALVVASVLGAGSAAAFAISLRLYSFITSAVTGASQQVWTSMAEALVNDDIEWVRKKLKQTMMATCIVVGPACLTIVVFGQFVVRIWAGPDLVPSLTLLVVLACWTTYAAIMSQLALFLNAAQVVGPQLVSALLMTIANIAMSIWLTHKIGLAGPILASIVSHSLLTGGPSVFLAWKRLNRVPKNQEASGAR